MEASPAGISSARACGFEEDSPDQGHHNPAYRWLEGGSEPAGALCRSVRSSTPSVEQTMMFGEGLLSHEHHKLLKGQQRLLQSFDGQPLDRLMLVPDDQFLLGSMHTHIDILTTERLLEIIGYIINEHAAIG